MKGDQVLLFVIVSFALAAVVLLKRESIPDKLRRPFAIFTLFMVLMSFVLIIMSFLQLGS